MFRVLHLFIWLCVWWVGAVSEELDHPGEFFFDSSANMLYYVTNTTTPPPAETSFEAPVLKTLISVIGTQADPVRNVSITGITFTGSAYTYMDAHSPPSGGDWSLQRSGALFFQGTAGSSVTKCRLIRLEGNGIMLSGYNAWTTISSNHIGYTGDTAIAGWGYTAGTHPAQPKGTGPDGTGGNFPRWTLIEKNFIHHLGIHEKQSSCWFQVRPLRPTHLANTPLVLMLSEAHLAPLTWTHARTNTCAHIVSLQAKTAETTLRGNICFDIPRAGFNFNDGFGGGNLVEQNLLFNTCGESGDHGAINTWDRQAFLTTVPAGVPTYRPAVNTIHHNFIVSNGDADGGAIDNDDGSSFYLEHSNFCIYGGAKMGNIDGHGKVINLSEYACSVV